jgi:hypothetical protein
MKSLAHPAQEPQNRIDRGRRLYADRSNEVRFEDGVWFVPSEHEATSVYEITLGRRGESCECQDFEIRNPEGGCKHIVAATIAKAKSTVCSCCGQRVPWKFVTEVHEEHQLLGWFVGDRLCADCVRSGYWA